MSYLPRALLFAFLAAISWRAHAESFMGINARSRMTSVQTQFPNAIFKDSKPAWLQPHERLVEISGPGIGGTLAIKLEHEVNGMRALAKELEVLQARRALEPWQAYLLSDLPNMLAKLEESPPTDPWEVKDIRWAPPTPIPIRTTQAKYGPPDADAVDEQFRRTLTWSKRGITAYVGENDLITLLMYTFTPREYVCTRPNAPVEACKEPEPESKTKGPDKRGKTK